MRNPKNIVMDNSIDCENKIKRFWLTAPAQKKDDTSLFTLDYFDECIGNLEDRSNPTALEYCASILRELAINLELTNPFTSKIMVVSLLLHLATKQNDFSSFYHLIHKVEKEAAVEKKSWNHNDIRKRVIELVTDKVLDSDDVYQNSLSLLDLDFLLNTEEITDENQKLDIKHVTDGERMIDGSQIKEEISEIKESDNVKCKISHMDDIQIYNCYSEVDSVAHDDSKESIHFDEVTELVIGDIIEESGDDDPSCDYEVKRTNNGKNTKKQRSIDKELPLTDNNRELYTCNVCHKTFKSKDSKRTHMKIHSGEKPYSCDICDSSFYFAYRLETHKRMHKIKPFLCDKCKECYTNEKDLNYHKLRKHEKVQKPFECNICGKAFLQKYILTDHFAAEHSNEKPNLYTCEDCKQTFHFKVQLNSHMRKHKKVTPTYEGPIICDVCGKSFNRKPSLLEHKRRKHGNKIEFECKECGKLLQSEISFANHLRMHTGEPRPFPCDECDKSFNFKHELIRHNKIHTGERPYKCKECDKAFIKKDHLKSHEGWHNPSFSCNECGKLFTQQKYLDNHKRIHTGEKPYKCKICSKAFRLKGHAHRHQKIHDSDKTKGSGTKQGTNE